MEATLRIEALTYGTAAIAHAADGKAVFVEDAAPGDLVRVAIDEDKKKFAHGRAVEVLEPGEARVAPRCPAAAQCGGCPWAHVSYEAQLEAKRANTVAQLVRIGPLRPRGRRSARGLRALQEALGLPQQTRDGRGHRRRRAHDPRAAPQPLARAGERARLPLGPQGDRKGPEGPAGRPALFCRGRAICSSSAWACAHSDRTRATEIALWTKPGAFPRAAAAKTLKSALHATSIVRVMADPGKSRAIKGVEVLYGAGNWTERLGDFTYKVSAPSFFQVNTAQAEKLIELVRDGLHVPSHGRVADLYCGVGTFTLPLADICDDVVAVESAASSVRDLRRNADDNGVGRRDGRRQRPRAPPAGRARRARGRPAARGLADGVPESIAAAGPGRVAYVSCDPATWARDVARMETAGYALERATPVDLFPQTFHNEVVSIFRRL